MTKCKEKKKDDNRLLWFPIPNSVCELCDGRGEIRIATNCPQYKDIKCSICYGTGNVFKPIWVKNGVIIKGAMRRKIDLSKLNILTFEEFYRKRMYE